MWITSGGEDTLLYAVRLCRMEIPPSEALDMSESVHLIISYLLRDKHGGLGLIVLWLVG